MIYCVQVLGRSSGKHYVECYVIKGGVCVRWTKPFFINVK